MSSKLAAFCCLCLTLVALPALAAPPLASAGSDALDSALPAGWVQIDDGVLQKQDTAGSLHTVTYGAAGQQWLIHQLEGELGRMLLDAEVSSTPELDAAIAQHRQLIADEKELLREGNLGDELTARQTVEKAEACDVFFGYDADASPGANADASAYFDAFGSNCPVGTVYAHAYCRTIISGLLTTASQTDPEDTGLHVAAGASCGFNTSYSSKGCNECYSYARAYVKLSGTTYQQIDSNSSCLGTGMICS